jgi:hypothetical protein
MCYSTQECKKKAPRSSRGSRNYDVNKKIEEYIPLDFMKIKGSRLARRVHIV